MLSRPPAGSPRHRHPDRNQHVAVLGAIKDKPSRGRDPVPPPNRTSLPPCSWLARSGNARVRRGMVQLAWRFLMFQKDSALAQWYRARTENAAGSRKTMVVALARKLLIALWRLVRDGVVPDGVILRPEMKRA